MCLTAWLSCYWTPLMSIVNLFKFAFWICNHIMKSGVHVCIWMITFNQNGLLRKTFRGDEYFQPHRPIIMWDKIRYEFDFWSCMWDVGDSKSVFVEFFVLKQLRMYVKLHCRICQSFLRTTWLHGWLTSKHFWPRIILSWLRWWVQIFCSLFYHVTIIIDLQGMQKSWLSYGIWWW